MPSLSLTDLVDVVSRAGTPKATKVSEIKNRKSYAPATDFYKPLRDGLIDLHRQGKGKKSLLELLEALSDQKKIANYPTAIDGYSKWWGKKTLEWFEPQRTVYSNAGIDVAINPELGLTVDGTRYLIKLYLKSDPLTKLRVDLITVLMEVALRPKCKSGEQVALLDARKSKLFTLSTPVKSTKAVVDAELAYVSALWPSV
jgi:hypothetical protein